MQYVINALAAIGFAFVLFVTVMLACGFVNYLLERFPSKNTKESLIEEGRKQFGYNLNYQSYWFSEDEPTMLLLQDFANTQLNISEIRERWRKNRDDNRTTISPV